jgi:hypothetical protein
MQMEALPEVQVPEEFRPVALLPALESATLHSMELLVAEHEVRHQTQRHHNLLDYVLHWATRFHPTLPWTNLRYDPCMQTAIVQSC